jgi:hypothetical protein
MTVLRRCTLAVLLISACTPTLQAQGQFTPEKPAPKGPQQIEQEDAEKRLADLEQRLLKTLRELEARLDKIEEKSPSPAKEPPSKSTDWKKLLKEMKADVQTLQKQRGAPTTRALAPVMEPQGRYQYVPSYQFLYPGVGPVEYRLAQPLLNVPGVTLFPGVSPQKPASR